MAQLSLSEVSKRFNINRTTIYRAVSSGKLSRLNNGMFDLAEVIRVFGEPEPQKGSIAQPANNENDREIISILKSQVELLTAQLAQKDSQIDHLQRLLVAPATSQQHASATQCNDTTQHNEMPIDQSFEDNSDTVQRHTETNSNVTEQQHATTIMARLSRGLKAFMK